MEGVGQSIMGFAEDWLYCTELDFESESSKNQYLQGV